ncbi:MAG: CDP-diacylglycerol--serine O-phosphatidyltransferase [Nanoarchaeota archaeon]|nr:CDP-diacylglycerol--serine O-phosphatidyltransferase [Nanoarchaeota archaeon]
MKKTCMLKILKIADLFTLANLICGLAAIFLFIDGIFLGGVILILAALIFDFLDGRVARITKNQNEFGKELDSLCDMVSFGIAPAVMLFMMAGEKGFILLYVIFACCGALRLARFNVVKVKGFIGMPITMNGVLFPALYFIGAPLMLIHVMMGVSTVLMVSGLRFRKM